MIKHLVRTSTALALVGAVTASACSKGGGADTSTAPEIPHTAAEATSVCASASTLRGVRDVLLSNSALKDDNSSQLKAAAATLQVRIDNAVLDKFDADTLKTSCSGQIHIVESAANSEDDITFTIQPSADRKSLVYTVAPADKLIGAVNIMLAQSVPARPSANADAAAETSNTTGAPSQGGTAFHPGPTVTLAPTDYTTTPDEEATDFVEVPAVDAALKRLLGSAYGDFDFRMSVGNTLKITDNPHTIYGDGSAAHAVTVDDAAYFIDGAGKLYAVIHKSGETPDIVVFGVGSLDQLPQPLRDFISSFQS